MVERERVWVLPDEPLPIRLLNTVHAARGSMCDEIVDSTDLTAWAAAIGMPLAAADESDVLVVRRLRGALRRIAAFTTSDSRIATGTQITIDEALDLVNQIPTRQRLQRQGAELHIRTAQGPATVADIIGIIRDQTVALFDAAGTQPVRACLAPGCILYFVAGHGRREWCSVACGNRVRAARHYRRHHHTQGEA